MGLKVTDKKEKIAREKKLQLDNNKELKKLRKDHVLDKTLDTLTKVTHALVGQNHVGMENKKYSTGQINGVTNVYNTFKDAYDQKEREAVVAAEQLKEEAGAALDARFAGQNDLISDNQNKLVTQGELLAAQGETLAGLDTLTNANATKLLEHGTFHEEHGQRLTKHEKQPAFTRTTSAVTTRNSKM